MTIEDSFSVLNSTFQNYCGAIKIERVTRDFKEDSHGQVAGVKSTPSSDRRLPSEGSHTLRDVMPKLQQFSLKFR